MSAEFVDCFAYDVTGDVHVGEPDTHIFRDALYVPKGIDHARKDAALYDRAGRLILQSGEFEGFEPPRLRWGTPLSRSFKPSFLPHAGRAIYGGVVTDHYGHFLTGCLSVLWYYSKYARPDDKVVFISSISVAEMFNLPWMAQIFALAGVRQEMVVVPHFACIFDELIVPGQAICDDAFVFTEYGSYCRSLGDGVREQDVFDGVYWLSKKNLKTGNIFIYGEDELEEYLRQHNVQIIEPQNITIDRQIALFRSDAVLVGFVGSAFHTTVFSPTTRTIVLSPDEKIRRTFQLCDAISSGDATYLHLMDLERVNPRAAFNASFRINDVPALGKSLLEKIALKASPPLSDNRPISVTSYPRVVERFCAYSVESKPFGQLRVDLVSGQVYAQDHERGLSSDVHLLISGAFAFLVAADQGRPALQILEDGHPMPVVSYLVDVQPDGALALRSSVSGLYMTVGPGGAPAAIRAEIVQEWELLLIKEQPAFLARYAEIVAGLERALQTEAFTDNGLRYAAQRLLQSSMSAEPC